MKKLIYLFVISIIIVSCVNEPVGESLPQNTIMNDSELFILLKRVTEQKNDPMQDIVCIDFIYPFKLLIYDTNLEIIGDQILTGDNDFSTFLGNLPTNQSISISYPIETTLEDGTVFSVNNNTELKIAIDSCSREDIISYCNGLFGGNGEGKCVWKVNYVEENNNKYVSAFFEVDKNNSLKFNFENTVYTGSWVFLFVNDELQLNINIEGTSAVAQDWNKSRKIVFNGDEIKIIDLPRSTILSKACEDSTIYQIGSQGPADGFVIYDKGFYSFGWRYIEAAPTDIDFFEWGCTNSYIQNTDSNIGKGLLNSAKIVNFHDQLFNYYTNPLVCSALNNGSVVAKNAFLYSNNNYTDWFLPSEMELDLIYTKLKLQNLGNFSPNAYWSSTEIGTNLVIIKNFNTGINSQSAKIATPNNIKARAIRYF
jgi:hypothetical protein